MSTLGEKLIQVPTPILAALGIPPDTESQMPISYGPLLDPFYELGSTSDEGDAWHLFGSPEGDLTFSSQSDALTAWRDLYATQIWLRDVLSRGSMRLQRGTWTLPDQVAHYLLIEQVVEDLYSDHHDYGIITNAIEDWFSQEAGPKGWFLTRLTPLRMEVAENVGPLVLDPAALADHMSALSCRWISRHHLAWRSSRAAVHEQGCIYSPNMIVHSKQERVWLNTDIMAAVWCRALAYAYGMPRIPMSVIMAHRSRPGMLRMLTGWVARAGWKAPASSTKISQLDLAAWYGHGPGQPAHTLKRRIQDDIGRIRLALQENLPVPALGKTTGLTLPGLQGIHLVPRRRPDDL